MRLQIMINASNTWAKVCSVSVTPPSVSKGVIARHDLMSFYVNFLRLLDLLTLIKERQSLEWVTNRF